LPLPQRIPSLPPLQGAGSAVTACVTGGALIASLSQNLLPFALALAIVPLCLPHPGRSARPGPRELAAIALFGSAAACVLWPSHAARLGQLLSELCHRGPEWWRCARIQSPPEIVSTLQGCVQPDRFDHLRDPLRSSFHTRDCSVVARALAQIIASIRMRSHALPVASDPCSAPRPPTLPPRPALTRSFAVGRSPPPPLYHPALAS